MLHMESLLSTCYGRHFSVPHTHDVPALETWHAYFGTLFGTLSWEGSVTPLAVQTSVCC